jgi:hypothetical protein
VPVVAQGVWDVNGFLATTSARHQAANPIVFVMHFALIGATNPVVVIKLKPLQPSIQPGKGEVPAIIMSAGCAVYPSQASSPIITVVNRVTAAKDFFRAIPQAVVIALPTLTCGVGYGDQPLDCVVLEAQMPFPA